MKQLHFMGSWNISEINLKIISDSQTAPGYYLVNDYPTYTTHMSNSSAHYTLNSCFLITCISRVLAYCVSVSIENSSHFQKIFHTVLKACWNNLFSLITSFSINSVESLGKNMESRNLSHISFIFQLSYCLTIFLCQSP